MICSCIHVTAAGIISFFFMAKYFIVYMYHIFFIHSFVDGHLCCFHDLATVNSATVNVEVHVSFWIIVLSRYMHRSEIAESYRNSTFRLQRRVRALFHSGCNTVLKAFHFKKNILFFSTINWGWGWPILASFNNEAPLLKGHNAYFSYNRKLHGYF